MAKERKDVLAKKSVEELVALVVELEDTVLKHEKTINDQEGVIEKQNDKIDELETVAKTGRRAFPRFKADKKTYEVVVPSQRLLGKLYTDKDIAGNKEVQAMLIEMKSQSIREVE